MNRKEFLKRLGMLTVGASIIGVDVNAMTAENSATPAAKPNRTHPDLDFPVRPLKAQTDHPITAIIIGAGSRGTTYGTRDVCRCGHHRNARQSPFRAMHEGPRNGLQRTARKAGSTNRKGV